MQLSVAREDYKLRIKKRETSRFLQELLGKMAKFDDLGREKNAFLSLEGTELLTLSLSGTAISC